MRFVVYRGQPNPCKAPDETQSCPKEQLGLALKGREIRSALLEELLPCLWHGCVDRAIALLHSVEPAQIKNGKALTDPDRLPGA